MNEHSLMSLMSESDENIRHSPDVLCWLGPPGCRRSDKDWDNRLWFIREAWKAKYLLV